MTRHTTQTIAALCLLTYCLLGCKADASADQTSTPWHNGLIDHNAQANQVTVIIALSSVVPGGIVGHSGIAVDDDYWDFGPQRTERLQPLKSFRSEAGPWWDDPEQQWASDRTLIEVLNDMPDKVHPIGSLVAIFQVQVTDEQAQTITTFWHDTYERMRDGDDMYRLAARQCASMVGWSLQVGLDPNHESTTRLPRELHRQSPTGLYEALRDSLIHTAGPSVGQPADLTLWQLDRDGFTPWQRPDACDRLALPELPRIRLAVERFKHLPADLITK